MIFEPFEKQSKTGFVASQKVIELSFAVRFDVPSYHVLELSSNIHTYIYIYIYIEIEKKTSLHSFIQIIRGGGVTNRLVAPSYSTFSY